MNYRVGYRDVNTLELKTIVISEGELFPLLDYRAEVEEDGELLPALLYTPTLAPLSRL